MTTREIAELLDKAATLETDGLSVSVKIIDARENFGRIDVCVTPEAGSGQAWVSADRVKVRGR